MSLGDTKIDSGRVDETLIFGFFGAVLREVEVAIKLLNRLSYKTLLVIQKTKFKVSIGLSLVLSLLILGYFLHVLEVIFSSIDVTIFRMSLSQLFVCL